jgi:hypothetical protein
MSAERADAYTDRSAIDFRLFFIIAMITLALTSAAPIFVSSTEGDLISKP